MKSPFVFVILLMAIASAAFGDCIILDRENIQVGSSTGIKGVCSNNNLPVTCNYIENEGARCDGPAGGFTGNDLDSLLFSACGCSVEEEKELQLKKDLEKPE